MNSIHVGPRGSSQTRNQPIEKRPQKSQAISHTTNAALLSTRGQDRCHGNKTSSARTRTESGHSQNKTNRRCGEGRSSRQMAEIVTEETERFRVELDGILTVLEELRQQGVVIPGNKTTRLHCS